MNRSLVAALLIGMVLSAAVDSADAAKKKSDISDNLKSLLTTKIKSVYGERALVGDILFGTLATRKTISFTINLPASGCYRFSVASASGISDLALALFVDAKEVARDRLSGEKPSVGWCSDKPVAVTAELYMYGGGGAFALAVFSETHTSIPMGIHKIGGEEAGFIANRVRQLYAQFAKRRLPVSPLLKGKLTAGESRGFDVALGGGCVTAIGVGDPSVRDFDVTLVAPDGSTVGAASTRSGFAVFETASCPIEEGLYRLTVALTSGQGTFGVQLYAE